MERNYTLLYQVFWTELLRWWSGAGRQFPWRETQDPFNILLAEILLQKTSAPKVVEVYKKITSLYPTIKDLASADVSHLKTILQPLGLLKRAERIISIARIIVNNFNGKVPCDRSSLLSLPGVGSYTADAVRCFAYEIPVVPVDTNIVRLATRVFGITSSLSRPRCDPRFSKLLSDMLPGERVRENVYALLDFAAVICTALRPKCWDCFWQENCLSAIKNS